MINDTVLARDVLLLCRGYEYLKTLETSVGNEITSLLSDLKTQLAAFIPPENPLPSKPPTGWSCPTCAGQLGLMFEALISTAIDIDKGNGTLLWGSERPDTSYYQPAFSVVAADMMCLSCSELVYFPYAAYYAIAQSDRVQVHEMPTLTSHGRDPAESQVLTYSHFSPLTESRLLDRLYHPPEPKNNDPHTFRLSASERLTLERAKDRVLRNPSTKLIASALFAGRGTLEIVGCASLLERIAAALSSSHPTHRQADSLRQEIEGRLEELFPCNPAREASLARLFSCASCGGSLHVKRRGQECTCVVIDKQTGRFVRGSAALTNHYLGRPSFYVWDADVLCVRCNEPQRYLVYDKELAELVFVCGSCGEHLPLLDLKYVLSTDEHTYMPVCRTCECAPHS